MKFEKKKVGDYILVNELGKGQFGKVFKALNLKQKHKVYAIKCIAKEKLENNPLLTRLFNTEVAVMSKIKHPNVMHLFEFMETRSNFYLVLQYCNNGDLEGYMKKNGRLCEKGNYMFI